MLKDFNNDKRKGMRERIHHWLIGMTKQLKGKKGTHKEDEQDTTKQTNKRKERTNKQMNNNNNNNNTITLQITLFDSNNRYKPISTLIEVPSVAYYKEHKEEVKMKALQKICNQRYITGKELARLGYNTIKVRNYTLWQEINKNKFKKRVDK